MFKAHVKAVVPSVTIVHCFIYKFAICVKVLTENMLLCLNREIKLVNFIKMTAINAPLLKQHCEDLSSNHIYLLYCTEVHWLPEVM